MQNFSGIPTPVIRIQLNLHPSLHASTLLDDSMHVDSETKELDFKRELCFCCRMNLMVITGTSDRSEIELYCALAEKGHRMNLLCAPEWEGEARLINAGVNVIRLPIRHRLDFHAVGEVQNMVREREPDLIYAPLNRSLSVALMATRKHNCPVIGYRGTTGHLSRFDPASWLTYFHPRLARIVCVSDAVRQYLINKRIPPDKLRTIYKGHRTQWYDFDTCPDLTEFGIPPDAFVVGFTGNMRPVKGVDVLIRAMAEVDASLNIHALLVGEVRDKSINRLAAAPAVASRVHLIGYRKDAAALSGACNAFAMPSIKREGLPRAVIEAMSQRVPAIVSNVGGMPELVEDGISGIVVPPANPRALANAIAALAADPDRAGRLGNAARKRIETGFHIDSTIDKIEKLFQQTLNLN